LAARSKTALFLLENGTADNSAAFVYDYSSMCEILAVVEDAGVHLLMSLLLGSAATSRETRTTPSIFHNLN